MTQKQKLRRATDVIRHMTLKSSDHIDSDLSVLADIHGLSLVGAVREGLSLLYGMYGEFGPDGFLRLDPPHHATTLSVEPEQVRTEEPNDTVLELPLNPNDSTMLEIICDHLNVVEQDVVRHSIHVVLSLRNQALLGGTIERFGSLGRQY